MQKSLIIIPTYNEKDNVGTLVPLVLSLHETFHILIVDDGSPDGTADIVKAMMKQYPDKLFLEERKGKLGLGTAYIHGFKWGIARGFDLLYEMDCDFSHPPSALLELMNACTTHTYDVAVGSRYTKGGKVVNWPWDRIAMSFGASIYTRMITWMPIKDPTAGFICYKKEVLQGINLDGIQFVGYAFQIEMKYKIWRKGFKIVEVPITFKDRELGVSKMSTAIFKEGFLGVWKMRFSKL